MAGSDVGGRHHLETIAESGLSNTQLTSIAESVTPNASRGDMTAIFTGADISQDDVDDDEDEEFLYPGASVNSVNPESEQIEVPQEHDSSSLAHLESQEFIYPGASVDILGREAENVEVPRQRNPPSPAQLESLCAASSSGDLPLLKKLFQHALESGDVEPFGLANDASSRTGFTALHVAASRGYLNIVMWLVESCGAMPDLEDREGETALHKATLNGHISVVSYLLPRRADVHARDADGWTALHNACSKGYLDIVKWLCDNGGATTVSHGIRGVDIRSKAGWTPLMNASSKGHLPVVLYLLTKQSADPFVRNKWGESAYDVAAAVFEIWICEVLQQAEAERWRDAAVPHNPLSVHTTVPLVLYENQRLDTRLKTVAVSGGRPKFSASGLGKHGRRAPFELKLPVPDRETGVREVAAWRNDVQLPLRDDPWVLPVPNPDDRPALDRAERSHFWLSDWTLDVTHPGVDAEDGWQYAHYLSDPEDQWTAEKPAQLQRILTGTGVVTAGFGGSAPSMSHGRSNSVSSINSARLSQTWVRRRRWVRIMRRRLDISPLPFLEPDGAMYHLDVEGVLIPYIEDNSSDSDEGDGQELGAMSSTFFSSAKDYVARSRYLVGAQPPYSDTNGAFVSAIEVRRAIAKLERATMELRQGILGDEDAERKTQAEVLLNAYSRELERRRLAAGAQGLLISGDDHEEDGDDDDDDDEFHYPGSSSLEAARPASRASTSTDYIRFGVSRAPTDLMPQLSQAPDFRVPTHEAPQKVFTPRWTHLTPHYAHAQWERDEAVNQCRGCQRTFNFLTRRHCRKCGRIFCDRCSSYRTLLHPSDTVQDPAFPDAQASGSSLRVCGTCYDEVNGGVPSRLLGSTTTSMERIVIDQARLTIPGQLSRRDSSSQLSDLAECPVCNKNLDEFETAHEQESHVKSCLEGGSGSTPQAAKYLVYDLPAESVLLGVECVICLEEFTEGSTVARLSCLCSFHNACLSSWLQRGKNCPIHAR